VGFTGLNGAAFLGIEEIAIDLMKGKGWGVNSRGFSLTTPLLWAAKNGTGPLAKLLLD